MKSLYVSASIVYLSAQQLVDDENVQCICTLEPVIKPPVKLFVKKACDKIQFHKDSGYGAGAGAGGHDKKFACCLEGSTIQAKSLKEFEEMQQSPKELFLNSTTQNLVFVDKPNRCIWIKPPIADPPALVHVAIDEIHPLSKLDLLGHLEEYATESNVGRSSVRPCLWVGTPGARRSLGFVVVVKEGMADEGARMRPRKKVRVIDSSSDSLKGETVHVRGPTVPTKSLFGDAPKVLETGPPVSLRSQSFLQNMTTIPSFMESSMLPPELAVHRIEAKHFRYAPGATCGTFFYRVPVSDIYLRLSTDPRKTMIYNSKSAAIIDIVFKDFREGPFKGQTNSGILFFWSHVLQAYSKDEEIVHLSKENQARMDGFKERYIRHKVARWDEGGCSAEETEKRAKKLADLYSSWKTIVWHFIRTAFQTDNGRHDNIFLPKSRLLWLKPFPVSLYFYCGGLDGSGNRLWFSQRGQDYPFITVRLNALMKGDKNFVAAVVPEGFKLPDVAHDNLEWANGSKDYLILGIPQDEFEAVVRRDNTSEEGSTFSKDFAKSQRKKLFLGESHSTTPAPLFGQIQSNDIDLCEIGQTLDYTTAIITTPWYGDDAAFSEIYDLRQRDYETIIKWTGDKRQIKQWKSSKVEKQEENPFRHGNVIDLSGF